MAARRGGQQHGRDDHARAQTLDRESLGNACRNGAQFVNASPSDLAELRAAVEPVYSSLREDPATSRAIDAIDALRNSDGLSLACPSTASCIGHADGVGDGPGHDPR